MLDWRLMSCVIVFRKNWDLKKMVALLSSFFLKRKKKKLHTAAVALECEAGMLLSYYKGGLITENNVFVFSSTALVTQCCVCKPPATFHSLHKRNPSSRPTCNWQNGLHLRYSRIVLERGQMGNKGKCGVELHLLWLQYTLCGYWPTGFSKKYNHNNK